MDFDSKGFIFRSGPQKTENQNSHFWMNDNETDVDEFLGLDTDKPKGRDLVALAGYKRAISNFVSIVTGQNIPVVFNSKEESYTDGKKVVIGSNLDDKKFDVAVGLALHEGSHIKLSDFNVLRHLETSIPASTFLLAEKVGVDRRTVISTVKNILNYIEDRRIDSFIFRTSPGYKGYYHSMYEKYFYSKSIDKGLLSAEFRTECIESYMFRIVNLHNKNRQLGSLKGLKSIYNTINLAGIQRGSVVTDTSMVVTMACEVMDTILMEIDPIVAEDPTTDEEGNSPSSGDGSSDDNTMSDEDFDSLLDSVENGDLESSDGNGSGNSSSVELPGVPPSLTPPSENMTNDDGSEPVELTDNQKKQLENAFKKQEKFLEGNIQKTQLSKKDSQDVKSIDESGASYEQVGGGISDDYYGNSVGKGTKCLVIKKLTQGLIDSNMFGCATSYNQRSYNSEGSYRTYSFVEEGLRLGSMLGRKLQVRSEENTTKFTRQDSGRLDKRLIAELGFDNANVFSQTFVDRFNKAYLHISVDASGSMCGDKWNKAMTSAVAMIKAADMAGNIEVVLSIRATHDGRSRNSQGVPLIMVCYDSRTDKLSKVRTLFPSLDVTGTTPEGLCFEAIAKDLIPGNGTQDSYFINFSDGQPWYSNGEIRYSGHEAERHTNKMITNMRNQGIKVLSYFIGGSYDDASEDSSFKRMYGADASFINATNMMQVARTMNKKFLQK